MAAVISHAERRRDAMEDLWHCSGHAYQRNPKRNKNWIRTPRCFVLQSAKTILTHTYNLYILANIYFITLTLRYVNPITITETL